MFFSTTAVGGSGSTALCDQVGSFLNSSAG